MAQKMLIDATHAEETRVVVVDGNKVEEFDFETASRRQLAGNIYLAKVTRVEPSLQAAFVDYGGNRHGFLAFNEIHPDYYQIPAADRAALLAEERALADDAEDEEDARASKGRKQVNRSSSRRRSEAKPERTEAPDQVETREISGMDIVEPEESEHTLMGDGFASAVPSFAEPVDVAATEADATPEESADSDQDPEDSPAEPESDEPYRAADHATEIDDRIESVSDGDPTEEVRPRRKPRMRRYKIQEVVKVRQIMLVQVVKEERGNKGAALTTYLSLAGRYCVLMPNTARGGGISRKITNAADRQKLKAIANEIEVPEGAGLIVRTAGANRTKAEIKRDYEYLLRLWEQIRDLTLKSIAPTPIYAEGDLIKRSIRDLYSKNIDEVLVEGEAGYRVAKDFMKMIMPSHAKNVKLHHESMPLFARYQVESYLAGMFNPTVQLPSGGYIVIGITEALVAIDINSGRATREGSIEETALKTNLEAAAEIARQLRLRDLAGLIVIDFIDMEERRNNAAVEKMLKDRLKNDRARIQVGRISGFGLLEMSRQRLRPGMLEATTQPCPHCHGTGLIRSDDSMGLTVLRQIEEEGTRGRSREVLVRAPAAVVNFIINSKREHVAQIEARYGMAVRLEADPRMVSPDFEIEKFKTATRVPVAQVEVVSTSTTMMPDLEEEDELEIEDATDTPVDDAEDSADDNSDTTDQPRKKRRRRRRKRTGGQPGGDEAQGMPDSPSDTDKAAPVTTDADADDTPPVQDDAPVAKPAAKRRSRKAAKPKAEPVEGEVDTSATESAADAAPQAADDAPAPAKPKRTRRKPAARKALAEASEASEAATPEASPAAPDAVARPSESPETEPPAAQDDSVAPEGDPDPAFTAVAPTPDPEPTPDAEPTPEASLTPEADSAPTDAPEAEAPAEETGGTDAPAVESTPVMSPVIEDAPAQPEAPAKPVRKRSGWWSARS